jgi:hypothetical protein
MRLHSAHATSRGGFTCSGLMRDELSHALIEAMYELEVLPSDNDAALVGLYAVMDDLQEAIRRVEAIDCRMARSA